jgi:hypothetical protein
MYKVRVWYGYIRGLRVAEARIKGNENQERHSELVSESQQMLKRVQHDDIKDYPC